MESSRAFEQTSSAGKKSSAPPTASTAMRFGRHLTAISTATGILAAIAQDIASRIFSSVKTPSSSP